MSLALFWDRNGECKLLEPFPDSFEGWNIGDPLDDLRRQLLERVESLRGSKVLWTAVRAMDRNLVLEVGFEDGRQEIVRRPTSHKESPDSGLYNPNTFESEMGLLVWLRQNTALPIPRVLSLVHASETEPNAFAVIEKMTGNCLLNLYGKLSLTCKETTVHDSARMLLELSAMEVPQRIGTTYIRNGVVCLVPLVPVNHAHKTETVIDTLEDYFRHILDATWLSDRIGKDPTTRSKSRAVLDRLEKELPLLLDSVSDPKYRRCVLNHDDLNEMNVLIDSEGHITAIVDWEFHSTKPLILAAAYPCWLRYDGIHDPRFCTENTVWVVNEEDAGHLRNLYSELIKEENLGYWEALVHGEILRQVEEWLSTTAPDPGLERMSRWMDTVFSLQ